MELEKCIKVTEQASYQFYRRDTRHDHEEIKSEAYLAMCEAFYTWNPEKGRNLSSWVCYIVHRTLRKKFRFKHRFYFDMIDVDDLIESELLLSHNGKNAEEIIIAKEKHERMSKAAKKVLHILQTEDIDTSKKNKTKKIVKDRLRNDGFSWNKIRKVFKELKTISAQV